MVIALVILLSHQVFRKEPLLSTIFINDIENAVDIAHCALFKFADDAIGVHIFNSGENAFKTSICSG